MVRIFKLTGLDEARERFAQEMVERYQLTIAAAFGVGTSRQTVTHVGPSICPCAGCRKRREWHHR